MPADLQDQFRIIEPSMLVKQKTVTKKICKRHDQPLSWKKYLQNAWIFDHLL